MVVTQELTSHSDVPLEIGEQKKHEKNMPPKKHVPLPL